MSMFDITTYTFFTFSLLTYFTFLGLFFFVKNVISAKYYVIANAVLLFICAISALGMLDSIFFKNQSYYIASENLFTTQMLLECSFSFALNPLSFSFALLVLIIGAATNIYILNYFKNEADELTFSFWINGFIASMLILVFAANFFTLFLGWELIGLTSFFLINFWQAKRSTLKSSFKAFSFNLISDIFLLIALVTFFYSTGTSDCNVFLYLIAWEGLYDQTTIQFGAACLVGCAAIKSVQIFGHLWLPDSMEAPVPASSLIHSATLVSAGIYLLMKFGSVFLILGWTNEMFLIGAVTAAYGGVVAAAQTDMKKLLAYSTMSHCGFLWVLASSGQFFITILYLFLHGLFKAATFYCAGSFIRAYGTQDTRWMGRGSGYLRGDSFLLLLASMNLAGLPFTFGTIYKTFFFKVLVMHATNWLVVGLLFIGMLSSIVYFFRLTFFAIFDIAKLQRSIAGQTVNSIRVKLVNWFLVQPNHLTAVSILLGVAIVVVYSFFWVLNFNVLDLVDYTQDVTGFLLLKTQVELLFATYYIYFYAIYALVTLVLLLVVGRKNNFSAELLLISCYGLFFILFNMWGHIMTEANTLNNFNFGFSTYKSDILIHLSQWQYWWWFWFAIFWAMYFFIITRLVHKRTMQFNPIMNTSTRGHGKWGDFLVVLIPLSWCGNILINSNFILRMIEWQNESSLFTLRVQGKQWYWVYKFDATAAYNILAAPKNIGHNRWFITVPGESYCADTYYQALHLGAQLEYKQLYLKFITDEKLTKPNIEKLNLNATPINFAEEFKPMISINEEEQTEANNVQSVATPVGFYDFPALDETANVAANILESTGRQPLRFIKGVLNQHNLDTLYTADETFSKPIIFVTKFSDMNGSPEPKVEDGEPLWGFKQKKYKRLQKFSFAPKVSYNPETFEATVVAKNISPFTLKSTVIAPITSEDFVDQAFDYQNSIKYNRQRSELVPVNLARRLLRTKRTLVLPAHVNITVITNSYDVVHSWFIPGLGIKLDCVPGRSTHHTFYVDNVGFYYGQCAEICGRYHHHMPVRLCALPFEQFLVWWQKKGLKRLHRISVISDSEKKISPSQIKFRYKW